MRRALVAVGVGHGRAVPNSGARVRHAAGVPYTMLRIAALLLLLVACRRDMVDRPEKRPLGRSPFFDDRTASRPFAADVVPRDFAPHTTISVARGRQQYEIFCTPCHGTRGDGNGVIVQHGFPRPPDLIDASPQAVINAVTFGTGRMYSYPACDGQSIAAYIQTLQAERRR